MFKLTKRDTRTTPLAWIQNGPLTLEPILAKVPILYSLKTPENQKFSSDFRRYEIGILSKYCQYFGLFLFVSINFLLNWIWRAIYITYQSSKAFLQGKAWWWLPGGPLPLWHHHAPILPFKVSKLLFKASKSFQCPPGFWALSHGASINQ